MSCWCCLSAVHGWALAHVAIHLNSRIQAEQNSNSLQIRANSTADSQHDSPSDADLFIPMSSVQQSAALLALLERLGYSNVDRLGQQNMYLRSSLRLDVLHFLFHRFLPIATTALPFQLLVFSRLYLELHAFARFSSGFIAQYSYSPSMLAALLPFKDVPSECSPTELLRYIQGTRRNRY
jgi:hypothetical protein